MKKVIYLILVLSLFTIGCKKKKAEKITVDLIGKWEVVTLMDGSFNPYQNQPNEYHSDVPLSYNDACGNSVDYTKNKHLTSWVLTFEDGGKLIDTKTYAITDLDNDLVSTSPCGTPVYKSYNEDEVINKTWSLKGKELTIKYNNSSLIYEVADINDSKLLLSSSNAVVKGDEKVIDEYKKIQ